MHTHSHDSDDQKKLLWVLGLNLFFVVVEVFGGIWANSISILSDALHDLGDSAAIGLAIFFAHLATRKKNSTFTFGYKRFTVAGAVINSMILFIGSGFMIFEAIKRIIQPEETLSLAMIGLAIPGIIINLIGNKMLSHGHSHNEKAISLHLLEDVLGWAAVLVGGIIIWLTGWHIVDPILSIGISGFIMVQVIGNLKSTLPIFMEAKPSDIDSENIAASVEQIEGVSSIHDLHVWSIDGQKHVMTLHAVVKPDYEENYIIIKQKIRALLSEKGIDHATIEMEYESEDCQVDC